MLFTTTPEEKFLKNKGKEQKQHIGKNDVCPRCGCKTMREGKENNFYVSSASVYVCAACAVELKLKASKTTLNDSTSPFSDWSCFTHKCSTEVDESSFKGSPRFLPGDRVIDTSCIWPARIATIETDQIYTLQYDGDDESDLETAKDKELLFEFNESEMAGLGKRFRQGGSVKILKAPYTEYEGFEGQITFIGADGGLHIKVGNKSGKNIVLYLERDLFLYRPPAEKIVKKP